MSSSTAEPWRARLEIPAYLVSDAARYAQTTPQAIARWQNVSGHKPAALSPRGPREALSYLQLIEAGVVAAMRASGVRLATIRDARNYLSEKLAVDYPFARYRFKTDGKKILMAMDQLEGARGADKLLDPGEGGQLAWNPILSRLLREFDYAESDGIVRVWKVAGEDKPIRIEPAVAFGAPHINGVATWAMKNRWEGGESLCEIAEDYCLEACQVATALQFEGVAVDYGRQPQWLN